MLSKSAAENTNAKLMLQRKFLDLCKSPIGINLLRKSSATNTHSQNKSLEITN